MAVHDFRPNKKGALERAVPADLLYVFRHGKSKSFRRVGRNLSILRRFFYAKGAAIRIFDTAFSRIAHEKRFAATGKNTDYITVRAPEDSARAFCDAVIADWLSDGDRTHERRRRVILRGMRNTGLAVVAVVFLSVAAAQAGQMAVDINSMAAGTRFCPAPGADNSEFMSSYFSIDARTGQMTRHDANSGPVGMTPEPRNEEQVLFVSPPISVENVYVPPPGGPSRPPATYATGVVGQRGGQVQPQPQRQRRAQPAPQPRQRGGYSPVPQQNYYQPQPYAQQGYAQPQPQYQQGRPYAQQSYPQNYPQYPQATVNQGRGVATVPPAGYGARVAR